MAAAEAKPDTERSIAAQIPLLRAENVRATRSNPEKPVSRPDPVRHQQAQFRGWGVSGIGLSLGAGAAIALRQVANELYGASALDPAVLAAVAALLAAVALAAWAGPARGATKVNPVIVLSENWPAHPVRS